MVRRTKTHSKLLALAFFAGAMLACLGANQRASADAVLLDFSSPHCGPCRQMRPVIAQFIQAGYPIREVDVSRETQLAERFRVYTVPCFIMLVDGKVVNRVEGLSNSQDIARMFQAAGVKPQQQTVRGQTPGRGGSGTRSHDHNNHDHSQHDHAAHGPSTFKSSPLAKRQSPALQAPPMMPQPVAAASGSSNNNHLVEATVRIKVVDPEGQSYGTGTIIDARQGSALVLTCGHLFRETKGRTPVTVELFRVTPGGTEVLVALEGKVLSYDLNRDVGLIEINPTFPVRTVQLASGSTKVQSGERVSSVGCNNGDNPTLLDSRVTTVDRFIGPSTVGTSGAPVEGRSGGGLFNAAGQLIGVCFAADNRANEGLYSALPSIYQELRQAGIELEPSSTAPIGNDSAGTSLASNLPQTAPAIAPAAYPVQPAVAITNPLPAAAITPIPNTNLASNTAPGFAFPAVAAANSNITAVENATLQEIARRGAGSEVICIIRSKEPGGKSQIITLDGASPQFLAQLLKASQVTTGRQFTSHAVAGSTTRPQPQRIKVERQRTNTEGWSSSK